MIWTTAGITIAKIASLLSQVVLGWVLSENDFALYAIAISISSLIWTTKNGGLHKILLQRGSEYDQLAPGFFRIALIFNLAIMVLIALAGAPVAAAIYDAPSAQPMMWVIAASIPLGTASMVLRAKMSIDLHFGAIARIDAASAILRYGSMTLFALAGFGAMSFVLPMIVVHAFETVALWLQVRAWPHGTTRLWPLFRTTVRESRWVMITALVVALTMQGDYLVIGLLEERSVLGVYFFAFQLTVSFAVLFSGGIDSVMLPSFAKLANEPARQATAFLRAIRVLSFVITPLAIGAALVIEPTIRLIWLGKWDSAIIVAQLMLLTLITRLPLSLSLAFLESRGLWRARAVIQGIDSIGIMLAAGIGAWLGDLTAIALWSSLYRLITGLVLCMVVARLTNSGTREVVGGIGYSAAPAVIAGVLSLGLEHALPIQHLVAQGLTTATIFVLSYCAIVALFFRPHGHEALSLLRRSRPG